MMFAERVEPPPRSCSQSRPQWMAANSADAPTLLGHATSHSTNLEGRREGEREERKEEREGEIKEISRIEVLYNLNLHVFCH